MSRFAYDPPPASAPERDPAWKTEGGEVAKVARLMGLELMPWQRRVLDVALEYREGRSLKTGKIERQYHYHEVIVTVPRQSGKTTLMGPLMLHRAMTRPGSSTFFTAQTGQAAAERMRAVISLAMDPGASKLGPILKPTLRAGREGLKVPGARSEIARFSPTKDGLHGETPHLVGVDEFWAFSGIEGDDLVQAINPTQSTIYRESQIWWISTMGDQDSTFMNEMVAAGRAGKIKGGAYFEWSIPEGLDPTDPASWWEYHPALGNTIEQATLEDELAKLLAKDKLGEFLRAYGNRQTAASDPLISEADWQQLHDPDMPAPAEFAVAYEVGGFSAAVYAAWRDDQHRPCTRILRQAAGTGWVPGFLQRAHEDLPIVGIAADDGGPTRRITEQVQADYYLNRALTTTRIADFESACATWLEAARDTHELRHGGDQPLTESVQAVELRTVNGRERFVRDGTARPTPVIASALALWAWDHQQEHAPLVIA